MSEIEAIYAIWKREIVRFWRDKLRLLGSFIQPLLFLIVFGAGFSFVKFGQLNYQQFIFPGIVSMSLVGISIASGVSVIWDKEFGVFKEILVAPISRLSIFLGKALGGATTCFNSRFNNLKLSFPYKRQSKRLLFRCFYLYNVDNSICILKFRIANSFFGRYIRRFWSNSIFHCISNNISKWSDISTFKRSRMAKNSFTFRSINIFCRSDESCNN
jgi:hypothetical protein